ncbi:MAG: serine/threonine protein kinase [Alphaproteobacteria bacterium]|nr:serine/threonine protein kinase [Alphaproteobacteria bacterium]
MDEGRRYEILGTLGKGGFGTVYKARMHGAGDFTKLVALKVMNPEVEGMEEIARRTRDEARVLGLVRHRAIVQVDGLIRLEGRWTIVMEYVSGVDLTKVIEVGPVPATVALEVVEEVSQALDAAQRQLGPRGEPLRLLHRDIKPSNLQLTERGEVKVLDFGTARANFAAREAKTQALAFGTLDYMSPERMDFEDVPAGDIYALGAVFYELLSGQRLGRTSPVPKKHAEHVAKAKARLESLEVPAPVVDLCVQMLAYEPEDRPVADRLDNICRKLRAALRGPWLADWAEENVPRLMLLVRKTMMDGMTGVTLREQTASNSIAMSPERNLAVTRTPPPPPPVSRPDPPEQEEAAEEEDEGLPWRWIILGLFLGLIFLCCAGGGVGAWLLSGVQLPALPR